MRAVRVAVVSDSHLSDRTPEAVANWRAAADELVADPPDVVVHAGDLAADGPGHAGDLPLARRELDRLDRPVLTVPGNHDVGESPGAPPPYPVVAPDLLARFRDVVGPDRWVHDVGTWRVVGLNALVMGSGLREEEDAQWEWLTAALADPAPGSPAGPRHVVLVLHKPLAPPPDRPDAAAPHRFVPPADHARLRSAVAGAPVRAVVSGHVHQYRQHELDGVPQVWAPTTWAVLPEPPQPVLGEKSCGVLELALGADGSVSAGLRRPPGLSQLVLGRDVVDPYEAAH